jgi:L-rhamnose-H+ transport protein
VGAPLLNFGIQYGITLLRNAGQIPAGSEFSANTYIAWAVFLTASAVSQAGYCAWRVVTTGAAGVFLQPGTAADTFRVIVMASVWAASIALYGRSVVGLGELGTSFGWPILIGTIVLASNGWGLILGEWRGAPARAMRRMAAGSILLVVAAFLIGQGSR